MSNNNFIPNTAMSSSMWTILSSLIARFCWPWATPGGREGAALQGRKIALWRRRRSKQKSSAKLVFVEEFFFLAAVMASLVRQLQSKAAVATEIAAKHGSSYYKQLLENNKQYIQSEPTVQKCQELSKQLFYTRLARCFLLSPLLLPPCTSQDFRLSGEDSH